MGCPTCAGSDHDRQLQQCGEEALGRQLLQLQRRQGGAENSSSHFNFNFNSNSNSSFSTAGAGAREARLEAARALGCCVAVDGCGSGAAVPFWVR
jgi:hypothetical protein